jgi:ATP-binding cassette subfamily B protein
LSNLDIQRTGILFVISAPSGAGKTTLVKLLVGLYRPTSGRILLDGVDTATTD